MSEDTMILGAMQHLTKLDVGGTRVDVEGKLGEGACVVCPREDRRSCAA